MVISDLNLLCINQKKPVLIQYDGIGIDFLTDHNGYGEHWDVLKKCDGMWYQLYPIESNSSRKYSDEFFDCRFCGEIYFVEVRQKYLSPIVSAIKAYLALSPIGEILLLIRLDEHGESKNVSNISFAAFAKKLKHNQICFNTIYRVYK